MMLLLPLALLGLLTLPAILLLHLLRNRRQQLAIPSLRLWQGLQQEKRGGRPRHIPLSLMLLLQLLAATALTLALARPALSLVLGRPEHVTFVLDMSSSMTALDGDVTRFETARRDIERHLQTMAAADTVAVVGLLPQPEVLFSGSGEQKSTLLLALQNLVPGAVGGDVSQSLSLANSLIQPDARNRITVLTDGAFSLDAAALPLVQADLNWQLIPASLGDAANVALLNVSAVRLPDGRHRVFARAVNYGDAPAGRTLRVFADDSLAAETVVQLAAQADAVRVWTLPATAESAAVEIIEPDILPADNLAELYLGGSRLIRVLLLSDSPAEQLARALRALPDVELDTAPAEPLPASFDAYDLVVFNRPSVELTRWPQGSSLLIDPPLGHPLLPAERSARDLRPDPLTASPWLAGLELSGVFVGRAADLDLPEWAAPDLTGRAANAEQPPVPLIFHGVPRPGSQAAVWTFDLDNSNLPGRVAFPLLLADTVAALVAPSPPPVIAVGQPVNLPANYAVETPDGHRLFLDSGQAENQFGRTRQPGLYRIFNSGGQPVAGFAVHAGSPQESNLQQRVSPDALAAVAVNPQAAPAPEIDFDEYWPWLAGLALLLVVGEGWLAWRK